MNGISPTSLESYHQFQESWLKDILPTLLGRYHHFKESWSKISIVALVDGVYTYGFGFCLIIGLLMAPFIFIMCLVMIWSLAGVGLIRKTLSTILFCCLFPPLYVVLIIAGSWALCLIVTLIGIGIAIIGPIVLLGSLYYSIVFDTIPRFIGNQRSMNIENRDITIGELFVALIVFVLSLPTTGTLVAILTLLKAPFVIVVVVARITYTVLEGIFNNSNGICFFIQLAFFPVGFCIGVTIVPLLVIVSIVAKILLAGLWPAYVASGWIRSFQSRRMHPGIFNPLQALKNACIASYQVIWFSDAVTNLVMKGIVALGNYRNEVNVSRLKRELYELASGSRNDLSPCIKALSMFPSPMMIGILQERNNWTIVDVVDERRVVHQMARRLGADQTVLEKIWYSLFEHSYRIGQHYIENQLLTADYLSEMPPAAITGLPQLALLRCIERTLNNDELQHFENALVLDLSKVTQATSSEQAALLSSRIETGFFVLNETNRPRGNQFVNNAWKKMMEIKKIYQEYEKLIKHKNKRTQANDPVEHEKAIFEAILLSGGESYNALPVEFQSFFEAHGIKEDLDFEKDFFNKSKRRKKLLLIRNKLNDVIIRVTKEQMFKNFMMSKVINRLTSEEP